MSQERMLPRLVPKSSKPSENARDAQAFTDLQQNRCSTRIQDKTHELV
jgi:hypothetical protein